MVGSMILSTGDVGAESYQFGDGVRGLWELYAYCTMLGVQFYCDFIEMIKHSQSKYIRIPLFLGVETQVAVSPEKLLSLVVVCEEQSSSWFSLPHCYFLQKTMHKYKCLHFHCLLFSHMLKYI